MARAEPLGVTLTPTGVNVAVYSHHATGVDFCLFDGDVETRFALSERLGDVWYGHIDGVRSGARYGLRVHGPYDPLNGHRFNAHKLLIDPYARALDGPIILHDDMYGYDRANGGDDLTFSDVDSAAVVPKCVVTEIPDILTPKSFVPWSETVLYEAHVRGFSKLNPSIPETDKGKFSGLAQPINISYFQSLGVNCLELMPLSASMDERHLPPLNLTNYWGYNHIAFLVPATQLASDWSEVKDTVSALNRSGIEVLVDVVYNHSGESDELGPTVCFRGLDNASYYRLIPDNKRFYINDMGCGNCLALDRPQTIRLVMDSLRAWAQWGGVQGFRFDLAPALGRYASGYDVNSPLLSAISQDPVLRELKLIAEPWDIGMGGYQLGEFPSGWGEWNDKYRDVMRDFWRGHGTLSEFATRLCGSPDFFGQAKPSRSINFITAHDGFTLADLVSYNHKHNEANGEFNRDGTDQNRSWNNGVEGPTTDAAILAKRLQDQRNLLSTLLFSRGTPMLSQGAEFGQTQGGNNNAYAQDNEISWADWARADAGLLKFTQNLIGLRKALPEFFADEFLTEAQVRWLDFSGARLSDSQWQDAEQSGLVVIVSARSGKIALAFNRSANSLALHLPPEGWRLRFTTQSSTGLPETPGAPAKIAPRTILLLQNFDAP